MPEVGKERNPGIRAGPIRSGPVGLQEADLLRDEHPVITVRNAADDEAEISHLNSKIPQVHVLRDGVFVWKRRLNEVARKVYETKNRAWEGSVYVPCHRKLGSGTYGNVFLGFKKSELHLPISQRHLVAMKECPTKFVYSATLFPQNSSESSDESSSLKTSSTLTPSSTSSTSSTGKRRRKLQQAVMAVWNQPSDDESESEASTPYGEKPCNKSIVIETACLLALRHPNIVRMVDWFACEEAKSFYLILEYCDAGNLDQEIRREVFIVESVARYFFKQIVAALVYMNDNSIVHRDIKPANILLRISPNGRDVIVKVADFGLSVVYEFKDKKGRKVELMSDSLAGTRTYAAPEGLRWRFPEQEFRQSIQTYSHIPTAHRDWVKYKRLHPQPFLHQRKDLTPLMYAIPMFSMPPLDVYAAGMVLYRMLTGEPPYRHRFWPVGLDLVFRGEAIRNQYLVTQDTFNFFKLITNPDLRVRPPIQVVQNLYWMRGAANPPHKIQPSTLSSIFQAVHVPKEPGSEGYQYLGNQAPRLYGPDGRYLRPRVNMEVPPRSGPPPTRTVSLDEDEGRRVATGAQAGRRVRSDETVPQGHESSAEAASRSRRK